MNYELPLVVEKVAVGSQKVVKRETIKIYDIQCPTSILELGLRHSEQIALLEKVQYALLAEQSVLIDLGFNICPSCGTKLKKNGYIDTTWKVNRHRTVERQLGVVQAGISNSTTCSQDCPWKKGLVPIAPAAEGLHG